MEKQVPDLERCKRLKELGIFDHPSTMFYFNEYAEIVPWSEIITRYSPEGINHRTFPAPLVSEMLEVMPSFTVDDFDYAPVMIRGEDYYTIGMATIDCYFLNTWQGKLLPNICADLLIWLKENNHLEAQ